MKKKFTHHLLLWVIPLLILMTPPSASAGHDQQILDREVSLDLKDVPLAAALTQIESVADVKFVYSPSQIDLQQIVSVAATDKKLGAILNDLLGPLGISYNVDRGKEFILLRPLKAERSLTVKKSDPTANVFPQAQTVRGTVTDAATHQPIAGVNIIVKGTTSGTAADSDGKYTIEAGNSDVLVFSFIGYKKTEVPVEGRSVIDIALEQEVSSLKEVVINAGYYSITDKMKTGNITKVTEKDIQRQPLASPLLALQGRVPGLEITPRSGTPGSAPIIVIRGHNSLRYNTGNYPLFVIDGIPINSSQLYSNSGTLMYGGYDPISTINPDNIKSIEVLKDADATAIYGSRGANGVILITTKQVTSSTKTNFDFSIYRGAGEVSNKLPLLNTPQYLQMRKEAFENDGLVPGVFDFDINGAWDTTRYTDWQEVLLGGTSNITNVQAAISGGNNNTSFRLQGGYYKETLVFPGDFGYRRSSVQLNVNHQSPDSKLNLALAVNYGFDKNALFDGGLVGRALTLPPNAPNLYNEGGELNWEPSKAILEQYGVLYSTLNNPLSYLRKTHDAAIGNLLTHGSVSYRFTPGLVLKSNFGYSELSSDEVLKTPISYSDPNLIGASTTGDADFSTNSRKSWIAEPQLIFRKEIGPHELDLTIGATWQKSLTVLRSISAQGYTSDVLLGTIKGATTISYSIDDFADYKYNALFGRVGYNFKQKYLINLTGRRDGSSRFGPGNRYSNFGAVGIGWIFSEEQFVNQHVGFLSFGKIRASYGKTGNDQIGDYQFYSTYSINGGRYQDAITLSPTALYNPEFQWETTNKLEAAIHLGFLRDRINLELSWYQNRSSNQLVSSKLPTTTGFSSILSNFPATVENKGLEFVLRSDNIDTENFKWTSSLNISQNQNKLVSFVGIEDSPYAKTYKVGESLSIQRLFTWAGVNSETGLHEVLDINKDGFINDDDKTFMNPLDRKYYGGLVNSFIYRAFELSFLIQFTQQELPKYLTSSPGRFGNIPVDLTLNRWKQPGDITDVQKLSTGSPARTALIIRAGQSNFNVEDASFIRLKTLSLTYNLPHTFLQKFSIDHGAIFMQCQNLITFTNYLNLDPETESNLPPLRMITGGIELKF